MKIIQPSFLVYSNGRILDSEEGIRLIKWIEFNARISHRSEEGMTEESYKKFIPAVVMGHGDWSIVEHATVTVIFRVDRGVTHELVRHRLFSFTQESTRFVNYNKKNGGEGIEFILPAEYKPKEQEDSEGSWEDDPIRDLYTDSENAYMRLIEHGVRPQEARAVLPNGLAATISVTGNLRNWRHFLLMRTSKETHPDFRRVTIPLLGMFQESIPFLYDDIVPNERQIDNMKKAR